MEQPESCKGCSQAHACERVYEQLGKAPGPSVVPAVLVAFLLPILVFTGALAACRVLLEPRVAPQYQTPLSLTFALAATTALMLIVRVMTKRFDKRNDIRN